MAEVGDEGVVDVDAAEVVESAGGEHSWAGGFAADDGDVEGAAAEVEDGEGGAGWELGAEEVEAVVGGGDGFVDEVDGAEAGEVCGGAQEVAAGLAPVGGAGEDGGVGGVGAGEAGFVGDSAEAGGEELFDGDVVVAEEDGAVVDAAFGVWFEAVGLVAGESVCVAAGVGGAGGVDVDAAG